jgi:hypothetical protein
MMEISPTISNGGSSLGLFPPELGQGQFENETILFKPNLTSNLNLKFPSQLPVGAFKTVNL